MPGFVPTWFIPRIIGYMEVSEEIGYPSHHLLFFLEFPGNKPSSVFGAPLYIQGESRGIPQARWMIYFMENPQGFFMDDDWGYPIFSETSL